MCGIIRAVYIEYARAKNCRVKVQRASRYVRTVRALLTPEQQNQFDENLKNMREERGFTDDPPAPTP